MIQDPDDPTKMIDNPDYDPTKNEDGTPIAAPKQETAEEIEARLKLEFKQRMDALDQKRKDAETRVAEFERKEREAETQRLKDEGKLKEAYERELEDERAARRDLENRNTELTRDRDVEKALRPIEFRNDRAADMAAHTITSELVKNDQGEWVHKSGKSIADFVAEFVADEANAFMLKAKKSSGAGQDDVVVNPPEGKDKSKSVFGLSQAEILKRAEKGELPHQKKRR